MQSEQQLHHLRTFLAMYDGQLELSKQLQARTVELMLRNHPPEVAVPALLAEVKHKAQQQVAVNELLRVQIALLDGRPLTNLQDASLQLSLAAAGLHFPAVFEAHTTDAGLVRR